VPVGEANDTCESEGRQDPQQPADHRNENHGEEVTRQLLIAGAQPSCLFEPTDATFNHVAGTIGVAVKIAATGLIAPGGDDRADPMLAQPTSDSRITVTLVRSESFRPALCRCSTPRDADLIHRQLEPAAVVILPRADLRGQRYAISVADEVDFGSVTAA